MSGKRLRAGPAPRGGAGLRRARTGGVFAALSMRAALVAAIAGALPAPPAPAEEDGVPSSEIARMLMIGRGAEVALPSIRFEFDSDRLTPSAAWQVEQLGKALLLPGFRASAFRIEGHTDSAGAAAYNDDLSLRRARSVVRRLVSAHGVPERMLTASGFGERRPLPGLAPDDERNRRVEIRNLGSRGESAAPRPPDAPDAATTAAAAPRPDPGRAPARKALLIGIDAYTRVAPPLNGPVRDARAMRSFLVERLGYEPRDVKMLLDGEATKAAIVDGIRRWLAAGTARGDEAFLYFSGHGAQQMDGADRDERDGMDETLVPIDAALGADGQFEGMITDDEIAALLDELAGRRVWVVVDACHSGTAWRGGGENADDAWRFEKTPRLPDGSPLPLDAPRGAGADPPSRAPFADRNPDIVFWTAVRAHQKALVDRHAGDSDAGSVFTRRLLWGARDGKADKNGDGAIAMSELHDYVIAESRVYCVENPRFCPPAGLTPQLSAAPEMLRASALGATEPARGAARTETPRGETARLAKDILVGPAGNDSGENRGGFRLSMRGGPRIELGQDMEFTVESDRDGTLVLLDIDAAGALTQIFPNEFSSTGGASGRIRAGSALSLPGPDDYWFRYRAGPPAGSGLLIAVLSDGNARLQDVISGYKDLTVVARPDAYIADLGDALGAAGPGWRTATLAYEIMAPEGANRGRNGSADR